MEFRIKDCQLQADESGQLKVGGYINVTERESEMLYNKKNGKWFKEIMKKGVFQRAIERAGRNIPLLFEHDWNKQLASIEEGSLTLREDNVGLRFDAVIKDESVYQQVRAGIINSCSFGFKALAEEVEAINSRLEKRVVNAIELMEVSLVKNPAYVGSLCETRSYEEEMQERQGEEQIAQVVEEKINSGALSVVSFNVETKTNDDGVTVVEYSKEIKVQEDVVAPAVENNREDEAIENEIAMESQIEALEDKSELETERAEGITADLVKQIVLEILAEEERKKQCESRAEEEEVVDEQEPETVDEKETVEEEVVEEPTEENTDEESEETPAEEEEKVESQRSLHSYKLELLKLKNN